MAEEAEADAQPAKKGGGLLAMILPAVIAGGVAFGISYVDPFGDAASGGAAAELHDGGGASTEKDGHGKKKKGDAHGGDSVLLTLEPIVVSLTQTGGSARRPPRLRAAIAVEGHMEDTEEVALRLRDAFTSAIRDVPPQTLGGPGGLEALRQRLMDEATALFGEGVVSSVLITDFLMT
ncbi:flagellar basal body-associated FliL family protein [Parvularcula sp. LCG005]|uniref:flagellar basal body-associated FliL family protein n=1 Tax=Parvularcula sp. LCG005 TaxID=3078805 RepID=UPI0029430391|nr:flagellar basal body-associated FliL family protein [Parvularcula sp. LCG005]WOI52929.1 flagellar basal body-associated FliL family protein [Parvularcula sp. LCG005]